MRAITNARRQNEKCGDERGGQKRALVYWAVACGRGLRHSGCESHPVGDIIEAYPLAYLLARQGD